MLGVDKLPSHIRYDLARERSIHMLMHAVLPHLPTALAIEAYIYRIYPPHTTPPAPAPAPSTCTAETTYPQVHEKYCRAINFLTFALEYPELQRLRKRIISNYISDGALANKLTDRELHMICTCGDISKLEAAF